MNNHKLKTAMRFLPVIVLIFAACAANIWAAGAPVIYALNRTTSRLVSFKADNPSVYLTNVSLDSSIRAIDFRPSNGRLYGVQVFSAGADQQAVLYTINPSTGGVAIVSPSSFILPNATANQRYEMDFSPAVDIIRLIGVNNQSYRINPNTGTFVLQDTNLAYAAGDPNSGAPPIPIGVAYDNNTPNSTASTAYVLDYLNDTLSRLGGTNGTPSPNTGQLTTIGLFTTATAAGVGGFDIERGTNRGYAVVRSFGSQATISELRTVNLQTGATASLGTIGNGTDVIDSATIAPAYSPFDFTGDGQADVSVFRQTNGGWYSYDLRTAQSNAVAFGQGGDTLTPADYDGDGRGDQAVYRNGVWYLLRSSAGFTGISFGAQGDFAVPADFDGDERSELCVYRPSNGNWYTYNLRTGAVGGAAFGAGEDKPLPADYDGDGKADFAVWRPSNGVWYLQQSTAGFAGIAFGVYATDIAMPADYDGDGKTDIAVFRNSTGNWYINRSSLGFTAVAFGQTGDGPVAADYDGDGKADIAVFRSGTWYIQRSASGFAGVAFGLSSDFPVPRAYGR